MSRSNLKKILKQIEHTDWYADWSGPFPLVEISTSCRIYFNGLRKVFGRSFSSFLVDYKKGIASVWLSKKECRALGEYLGKKLRDARYAKLWAKEFRRIADKITRAINKPPKVFLEKLESLNELYETYGAYSVATKLVVDITGDSLDKRTKRLLESARKYSETFYKDNSRAFCGVAELISRRTGYANKNVLMMTRNELLRYVKTRRVPPERILLSRHTKSAVYFTETKTYFLSAAEIAKIEKIWTKTSRKQKLRGKAVFAGKVKGRCRIILDYRGAALKKGEVLITGMTDPNYLFLMKKAAAIITDGGGMLSHAAIAARELKIPCIIGTKIATKVLNDGDWVEVDAEKGTVRVLNNKK